MKITDLTADLETENEGDWVTWPKYQTVSAKVRSVHNPDYERARAQSMQDLQRFYSGGDVPTDASRVATGKLFIDHILLDIRGLTDDDGNELKLTPELARSIMLDRKYRPIADFVVWAANRVGNRELQQLQADMGNSSNASDGTKAGAAPSEPSTDTGSEPGASRKRSKASQS